jgi:hypothetical protein
VKLTGDHCQCTVCGKYFNSVYAFDKHRTGGYTKRRCFGIDEMLAMGMARNHPGFWISRKKANPSRPGMQSSGDRPDGTHLHG